ncbi:metal ABC transporter solute-binding protein, Zn/Mn family [Reichenbachiella versicolor]|uniref:metal ABC transporter solute-binding protein, Zn/Mn family n=1 Tax=Reichenbachiella versicolor TaxID=1821036 RepID=UPI000D6E5E3B|nr:zinc ABC transporter substrate-binding protein [Reichenbachiella versicolor]
MKNILLYTAITIFALSCQPVQKERQGKLKVITTTGMIYDAVLNIGGNLVEAEALMGPGVDPHLYKATQGDLAKLQNADLILYNGLHLEGKMGEIFEKLSRIKNVHAISEDIDRSKLRASQVYENAYDPHIWFDVKLWKEAVVFTTKTLSKSDSINAKIYQANSSAYLKKLDSLHGATISAIDSIPEPQRLLITAHDAFGYFGDAYKIRVEGLQGISTLSEPGLKDITKLVDLIVDNKVKAVFIETSVSKKAINAVVEGCKDRGHDVIIGGSLYSDAMGSFGQFEGTYIGMVSSNVNTIVNALK